MFPRDPQEPRLIAWIRNPRVRRTMILAALWTFIAAVLIVARFVLLPFGLAVLLAFIIEPLIQLATRFQPFGRKVPRVAAVIAIYVVGLTSLGLGGSWALAQVGREVARVGAISARLLGEVEPMTEQLLQRATVFVEDNNIPLSRAEIETFLRENLTALLADLQSNTAEVLALGQQIVGGTVRAIFGLFLVLMLTAFLAIDRDRIERFFFTLVPPEYATAYRTVTKGMGIGLAGVVRGQVLICLTNGVFTFAGLWLLGVKLPLLLATIATVFSLIPVFGSILSTIPIVAIALSDSLMKGFLALVWIIVIHLIEANLLNPKIMGDAAKIHPVIVVFALIVGEQAAGLMGALFAVPITSVVLTIFKFLHQRALDASREASTGDLKSGDLPHPAPRLPRLDEPAQPGRAASPTPAAGE